MITARPISRHLQSDCRRRGGNRLGIIKRMRTSLQRRHGRGRSSQPELTSASKNGDDARRASDAEVNDIVDAERSIKCTGTEGDDQGEAFSCELRKRAICENQQRQLQPKHFIRVIGFRFDGSQVLNFKFSIRFKADGDPFRGNVKPLRCDVDEV
jgi:hypothetical protein